MKTKMQRATGNGVLRVQAGTLESRKRKRKASLISPSVRSKETIGGGGGRFEFAYALHGPPLTSRLATHISRASDLKSGKSKASIYLRRADPWREARVKRIDIDEDSQSAAVYRPGKPENANGQRQRRAASLRGGLWNREKGRRYINFLFVWPGIEEVAHLVACS